MPGLYRISANADFSPLLKNPTLADCPLVRVYQPSEVLAMPVMNTLSFSILVIVTSIG